MAATNRRSFQWDLWQNPQGLKGSYVVEIWDLEIFCVMVRLLGRLREMRDLSNSGKDMPPHPHDKLHCLFKDWFQLIWLVKQMRQMRWWGPYFSPFSNPKHRISFDMTHYSANFPWHTIHLTCFLYRFPLVSHFFPFSMVARRWTLTKPARIRWWPSPKSPCLCSPWRECRLTIGTSFWRQRCWWPWGRGLVEKWGHL